MEKDDDAPSSLPLKGDPAGSITAADISGVAPEDPSTTPSSVSKTPTPTNPEASTSTSHLAALLPLAQFRTTHLTDTPHPRPTAPKFKQTECAICLSAFERGDVVRILPCGHVFHKDEVDAWLLSWKKVVSLHDWTRMYLLDLKADSLDWSMH